MAETVKKSRTKLRAKESFVDWKVVGQRIRELRGFYVTQEEFARRIGISQSHLSTLEHGDAEPGAEIMLRISREFGKSIEWLLTGTETK
jgi:transcriptional regulator with XRE-family HTH domain